MAYCRDPYYIWSDGTNLNLMEKCIDEEYINVFLYQLYTNHKEEFEQRLRLGKNIVLTREEEKRYAEMEQRAYDTLQAADGYSVDRIEEFLEPYLPKCYHLKVYENTMKDSPKYNWICKHCGKEGTSDVLEDMVYDNYSILKEKFKK